MIRVLGTAFAVFLLDLLTKTLALHRLAPFTPIPIIPGLFQLTLVFNRGAAFGLFPGGAWIFATLATLTIAAIFIFAWRVSPLPCLTQWALGMIAGGAAGNLLDRLRSGTVVDFLDFYVGSAHWPAFNVADSALCVGAGLLMLATLRSPQGAS